MIVMKRRIVPMLGLIFLCALIAACGGSTESASTASESKTPASPQVGTPPSNSNSPGGENLSALSTAKPGELLALTKDLLKTRAALRKSGQLYSGYVQPISIALPGEVAVAATGQSGIDATTVSSTADASMRSGTTNQELGVDEVDLVKIDGNKIYTLEPSNWPNGAFTPDRLHVYQRFDDGSLSKPNILEIPSDKTNGSALHGMLSLEGSGRLALLGQSTTWLSPFICPPNQLCATPAGGLLPVVYSEPKTVLQWVDVSKTTASTLERLVIDGALVGARQIDDHIYLTVRHAPQLAADRLASDATDAALNQAIASTKSSDILPKVKIGNEEPKPLVSETDCYLQTANRSTDLQLTVLIAWRVGDPPGQWTSRCFFGGTQAIYMSPRNLYLATSRNETYFVDGAFQYSAQMRTDIHQFAINSGSMNYIGSGDIPGHLGWDPQRAAYRMSEYLGDLRVISFTGTQGWFSLADASNKTKPPSPATLSVLRPLPSEAKLRVISSLPNANRPSPLGLPGEQIYGVRFDANRAYLVTFRQTDPLYILDLSEPLDPKMLGELKMPGYSDYLFPLSNGLLLGVGKDATQTGQVLGVRIALMDIKDPASPKELQVLNFGDRGSSSGLDYTSHGINLLQVGDRQRIALSLGLFKQSNQSYSQGLQTLEVDVGKPELKAHKWIASPDSQVYSDLSQDRSVQIGQWIYYWSRGQLNAHAW